MNSYCRWIPGSACMALVVLLFALAPTACAQRPGSPALQRVVFDSWTLLVPVNWHEQHRSKLEASWGDLDSKRRGVMVTVMLTKVLPWDDGSMPGGQLTSRRISSIGELPATAASWTATIGRQSIQLSLRCTQLPVIGGRFACILGGVSGTAFDVHRAVLDQIFESVRLDTTATTTPQNINLARGKPAEMSSTYNAAYDATRCNNGSRDDMCHTAQELNPWWQVDLQGDYALNEIVVYNRQGTWGDRERTLTALISSDRQNWQRIYVHNGSSFEILHIPVSGRTARYVRLQLNSTDYMNLLTEVFNNYNSHVECSYTDKATFTLRESIQQAQAALWYDFGNVTQNIAYTLTASGQTIGRGTVKKGACAAGYTWCQALFDLGNMAPGAYTIFAAPARICHNVSHDGGNGFIMISGVAKK